MDEHETLSSSALAAEITEIALETDRDETSPSFTFLGSFSGWVVNKISESHASKEEIFAEMLRIFESLREPQNYQHLSLSLALANGLRILEQKDNELLISGLTFSQGDQVISAIALIEDWLEREMKGSTLSSALKFRSFVSKLVDELMEASAGLSLPHQLLLEFRNLLKSRRDASPPEKAKMFEMALARVNNLINSAAVVEEESGDPESIKNDPQLEDWFADRFGKIDDRLDHFEGRPDYGDDIRELGINLQKQIAEVEGQVQEIKSINESVRTQAEFAEPVTFWTARKNYHEGAYKVAQKQTVLCGIGLIFVVLVFIGTFYRWKMFTDGFSSSNMISFGIILLVVSIGLVGFRTLLRITLSHLHLTTEYAGKVALTECYISMIRHVQSKEATFGKEEAAIFLGALVQPTNHGIIKDEGFSLDPSIAAAVSKAIAK